MEPEIESSAPRRGWLLDSPDRVEDAEPIGLLDVLLPWPVRLFLVAGTAAVAWVFRESGLGQQLSWGARAGALALMGILTGLWFPLLLVDSVFAGLWFIPFRPRRGAGRYWQAFHVITFVNRQVGHWWALLVWLVVALAWAELLPVQIGGALALLLLAPPVLNWLARRSCRLLDVDGRSKASGDLLWRRRPLIYAATSVGWVWLILAETGQVKRLLPLIIAWGVGWLLRLMRHRARSRKVAAERKMYTETSSLDARACFRQEQARAARRSDPGGMLVLPLVIAGLAGFSFWQRHQLDEKAHAVNAERAYPTEMCSEATNAPLTSDVAVFLLADAQLHELAGAPHPGQAEIAQVFAASASRPVALDMLSPFTVRHFAAVYSRLNEQRALAGQSAMSWAHLGDLADISCAKELERMRLELGTLASTGTLAGIAAGNHEMSFLGSFHWSPDWDRACASGKLEKGDTVRGIVDGFGAELARTGGEFVALASPFGSARGGSLSAVSLLGVVNPEGRSPRGIIGLFLDTNDGRAFDWGMPGSVGSVSEAQLDAVRKATARVRNAAPSPYRDPAYVVFSHIPLGQLASSSQRRVKEWLIELDARTDRRAEARVLAFISGHTHEASTEHICIGNRFLRQVTIGSSTDPPQQAAILEIGVEEEGRLALSVRSLQAIGRSPEINCGDAPRTPAAVCRRVAHELARAPDCRGMLGMDPNGDAPRDCQELERPRSFAERFASLQTHVGPHDPEARRDLEQLRAQQVLSCLCREGRCESPRQPLRSDSYRQVLEQVWERPERRDELVCLAWAASATQAHKAAGMQLGDALRCSFDDSTLSAERVYVATFEPSPCD
jgi:hypothetical protein